MNYQTTFELNQITMWLVPSFVGGMAAGILFSAIVIGLYHLGKLLKWE